MGADWSSSAVIGVKVPWADCHHIKRVKAFEHNHPDDWTHDPKNGRALWREVTACSLGEEKVRAAGFEVFEGGCSEDRESDLFIGLGVRTGSNRQGDYAAQTPNVDSVALKRDLEKFLSSHGLWDEAKFGLWSLLYVGI